MKQFLLAVAVLVGLAVAVEAKNPVVVMKTSMGTIKIELFEKEAPGTVKNFLRYVDDKFYDGTIFHRVIGKPNAERDFMIQGGGFQSGMREKKAREPIMNEADNKVSNVRGTIAMARTPDPHSASAQFFINVGDNKFLDHRDKSQRGYGYCAFGKVVSGMDVVDKIKAVAVGNVGGHGDVPLKDVVIESVRRE